MFVIMPWPRQLSKGTANRPGLFVSVAAQFHADKSQKKIASVVFEVHAGRF